MRRDRLLLALYGTAVVAITLVHDWRILLGGIVIAVAIAGREAMRLLTRTARIVLWWNGLVTISYAVATWRAGSFRGGTLLLLNVRVLLLTFLALLLARRVNLLRAVSFSPELRFVLVLAYGQIAAFRRLLDDGRAALASRMIERPTLRVLYRHAAANGSALLAKSMQRAEEITDGMRSRGFFEEKEEG
ncbi:MAG: ABC transporter permease [Candidatus Eisenbacteria bacterium]|nr:ABC transporter permease [Candidatus Eisenbacteria bacterium]